MKKRIYGLETEYAVIIAPKKESASIPTRSRIFTCLKDIISSRYKVLNSKELKQGVFMENGGRLHHEACLNALLEGVIEFSTPECTSCKEVALYTRAQDEILNEVREELKQKLKTEDGFSGDIFFGKNSTDNKGNFYGTHENYLVDDPVRGIKRTFLYTAVTIFYTIFLVIIIIFNLPILAILLLLSIIYIFFLLVSMLFSSIGVHPPTLKKIHSGLSSLFKIILSQKPNTFTRIMGEIFRLSTIFWAYSYGFCLRQVVFKKFTTYLTPYLLTRIIFSGAGRITEDMPANSNKMPFELSQKAESIRAVCTIFWDDLYKPVISLKNFIKSPRSVFQDKKRLHIMYSDSNMSDHVNYIKTGITGLIIRMIEENHPMENLTPKNPVKALREFSKDTSGKKKVILKNKRAMSALEIQKYYLAEAKKFYKGREEDEEIKELLKIWENLLTALELSPHMLYKELDWVAKRDLINEVRKNKEHITFTKNFFKWAVFFSKFYRETWEEREGEELKEALEKNLSWFKKKKFRTFLEKENITHKEFLEKFLLFYQMQKVDLKFHEINRAGGYYYKLYDAGLIREICNREAIEKAKLDPPEDTRANIRGFLIKSLSTRPVIAAIGWDDIVINNYAKRIFFTDPFQRELSEEDKNYMTSLLM